MKRETDRGAVAVETALLLPVLVLLLLGVMEFSRAYNAQVTLTHAAREGVRVMAISNVQDGARTAARNAMSGLKTNSSNPSFSFSPSTCPTNTATNQQMTMTISYTLSTLTGIAGPFTMRGVGVMRCNG